MSSEQQLVALVVNKMAAKYGFVIQSSTIERSKHDFNKKKSEEDFKRRDSAQERNHFIESGSKKGPPIAIHIHRWVEKTFNPVTIEARKMLFWANS